MNNLNKLDFAQLDTTGIGYHKWVHDVRYHLKALGIISAIRQPIAAIATPAVADDVAIVAAAIAAATQATRAKVDALEVKNIKEIIIKIRHMNESLQSEYLNEKDSYRLWVALEECFDNVHESLLPNRRVIIASSLISIQKHSASKL